MSTSNQHIRYKCSKFNNELKLKSLKAFSNVKEYVDYFLQYPENIQHLVVLIDSKRKNLVVGYVFKDNITGIVHYDISNQASQHNVRKRLANEYKTRSGCTAKEIQEIFSNLL